MLRYLEEMGVDEAVALCVADERKGQEVGGVVNEWQVLEWPKECRRRVIGGLGDGQSDCCEGFKSQE